MIYGVAKELTNIIYPLVGQSPHRLKNTQHSVQHIQKVKLEPGEVMTLYDVKALFNSVPVDPSINIVKHKLLQEPTLPQRTTMSIQQIVILLEFCLKNTYFLFHGKYYEQVHGVARGSSISPLIANLYMEECEVKALRSAPHPHLWLRYVDDTFVIQEAEHSQQILQHINTQDPHIQFAVEGTRPKGISTIPGHPGFFRSQQHPCYFSLQKIHTHTQTNIYTGTATISLQLNIVSLTPWDIEPK